MDTNTCSRASHRRLFALTIVAVIITGCYRSPADTGTPIQPDPPSATELPITETATRATLASATSTEQPSPVPTSTDVLAERVATKWTTNCLDVAEALPLSVGSDGLVLANQRDANGITRALLLNLRTGASTPLITDGDYAVGIAVSPDFSRLVYGIDPINGDLSPGRIAVQNRYALWSVDSGQLTEISRQPEWYALSHWLDNDHLVFSHLVDGEIKRRTLTILDPLTGAAIPMEASFPDIYDRDYLYPVPEWENYIGVTTYDATLTRAVYARIDDRNVTGYVLWDLPNNRPLAFLSSPYLNQTPKWSVDQSRFVVVAYLAPRDSPVAAPELFSVDRDGHTQQLTSFAAAGQIVDISHYSWSPDGRYVAFLYVDFMSAEERLGIVDLMTNEVTDYCIPTDQSRVPNSMFDLYPSRFTSTVPPPIWSPDSRQIIVENRYAETASRIILVDVSHSAAATIAENMMPIGWLASGSP